MAHHQSTLSKFAIVLGTFLSGTMLSLSAIAIPVYLDTLGTPAQLYSSWARTYHYGHLGLPAMSITTCLLYGIVAQKHKSANRQWRRYVLAALVTVTMVPFTWVFMTSTNNTLFGLHAESEAVGGSFSDARELVVHWSRLHLLRSLFPLAGAVIGIGGL
ncbi:hypothetical protein COCSADRAFT_33819 [Bipolaris sorokiniana ND90Pr]|uniref:DUF1772 domain-containing protein n=1 Tax=Cochliobolus sativus (strain ND90Pr / ATCC 201652) TaxID=665912 RepID=M2TCF9_COCSN|nr:uncharacterized protein COCSADRAFT_33819 [Bipolaris sorokiniana ND90Pr]EMD66891.1 hypothetical protein COCSADRAFT_33819 [Bipolaris sorokiniana ND90Pr]